MCNARGYYKFDANIPNHLPKIIIVVFLLIDFDLIKDLCMAESLRGMKITMTFTKKNKSGLEWLRKSVSPVPAVTKMQGQIMFWVYTFKRKILLDISVSYMSSKS